jgi:hypothetical protein
MNSVYLLQSVDPSEIHWTDHAFRKLYYELFELQQERRRALDDMAIITKQKAKMERRISDARLLIVAYQEKHKADGYIA